MAEVTGLNGMMRQHLEEAGAFIEKMVAAIPDDDSDNGSIYGSRSNGVNLR